MKIKLFFTLVLMMVYSGFLLAQANLQLKDSKITITGTSNLHDWESAVTQVKAEGTIELENNKLKSIPTLKVSIAVEGIKSTKGSVMDKKTYKALLSETHPNITFKLGKLSGIKATAERQTLKASGELTIAGTTKQVNLEVIADNTSEGNFHFSGSKALKMTDFNIEPPTALFGSLKTGDDITINFELVLVPVNASSISSKE